MKKISLIFVAAMLLTVGSVFANYEVVDKNPSKTLSEQIERLLSDNMFKIKKGFEAYAVVYFTVNNENEIVVLTVGTNDETLEAYIKSRLNYMMVDNAADCKAGVTYRVPVRIILED